MTARKQKKLRTYFLKQKLNFRISKKKSINRWPQSSEFLEQFMIDTLLMNLTQFEDRNEAALGKLLRGHDEKQLYQVK